MDSTDLGKQIVDLSQTQKIATQFRDESDSTRSLLKATVWLESICRTPGFTVAQRFDSVDLLDTSTRKHQKQIGDDYLGLLHANRKQEKLLWETAHGFWTALSAGYLECMEQLHKNPASADKLKAKLPVLAARGARAVAMQIKWVLFRFGMVEPQVWADLAHCQQFAEARKIDCQAVSLYLSNQTKSCPNEEFLRAVMLSAASMDSLSVMEQEIADRWIDYFASTFKVDAKAHKALNLFFDLDRASAPSRVAGETGSNPHRRYFGASDALPQMQEYLESTHKTGATPVPFRLPKGGEMTHVVKVLEHLMLHWGEAPPSREWDRRFTATTIEVKHDYGSVRQALADMEQGVLDFTDVIAIRPEYWIVDNAGRGGYRAIVPKGLRAWLRLGALIAMRLEFREFWSIAVIRRVETDEHQQRKVGIRMIARKPVTALMRSKLRSSTQDRPELGILLNAKPSRAGGVHMLMRPGTFALNEDIDITFGPNETTWSLTPSRMVEKAVDYDWVRYTLKS